MAGALEGIKILEWCIYQQGPFATSLLGDFGAEVIKIEQPGVGDPGRGVRRLAGGPLFPNDHPYYFEANNRNKRSITLDLSHDKGRQIVYRLVKGADVFVHNFRQSVPAKLGMDFESLSRHNPRMLYASASGWGSNGPDRDRPALDYAGAARSGIMAEMGSKDGNPGFTPLGTADQMGGIMLALGILTGLVARERHGIGQEVHVSHLGSMVNLLGLSVSLHLLCGYDMPKNRSRETAINPLWNHYQCSDGKWICLSMGQSDRYWSDFCQALNIGPLENDSRFESLDARHENASELITILDQTFGSKTQSEWLQILGAGDFIYAPVNAISDLEHDPQVVANGYITDFHDPDWGDVKVLGSPVSFTRTTAACRRRPPQLGEHTEEVLLEAGYEWSEIETFRTEGVI